MTLFTTTLLTAMFALGCGSGAMANPDRGQWTGYEPGYGPAGTAAPGQITPTPAPPAPPSQNFAPPGDPQSPQAGAADQDNWQGQDADQAQEQDESSTASSAGRPHLGVLVMGLTPELRQFFGVRADRGVLIAKVERDSAAAKAGVQVGDVLVRVGPRRVSSGEDVVQALTAHAGERIRLAVIRQGRPVRLLAALPGRQLSVPDQDQI